MESAIQTKAQDVQPLQSVDNLEKKEDSIYQWTKVGEFNSVIKKVFDLEVKENYDSKIQSSKIILTNTTLNFCRVFNLLSTIESTHTILISIKPMEILEAGVEIDDNFILFNPDDDSIDVDELSVRFKDNIKYNLLIDLEGDLTSDNLLKMEEIIFNNPVFQKEENYSSVLVLEPSTIDNKDPKFNSNMMAIDFIKTKIISIFKLRTKRMNVKNQHSFFLVWRPAIQTDPLDIGWYVMDDVGDTPLQDIKEKWMKKITVPHQIVKVNLEGLGEFLISKTTIEDQNKRNIMIGTDIRYVALFQNEKMKMLNAVI